MSISSIEQPSPKYSYQAYLPVQVDDPLKGFSGRDGDLSPVFEVRSVRPLGGGMKFSEVGLRRPTYGVVSNLEMAEDGDATHFIIDAPGIARTSVRASAGLADFMDANILMQQPTTLARKGWFRLQSVEVTFVQDPTQDPWQGKVWLPLVRVHRPDFEGCQSIYKVTDTTATTHDANFTFGPVGVGASSTFTNTVENTLPASATCKEVKVQAMLTVRFGQTLVNGGMVSEGTRFEVSDVDKNSWTYEDIDPQIDDCNWPSDRLPTIGLSAKNLLGATGAIGDAPTERLVIDKVTSGRMSLGFAVSMSGVPLNAGVTYQRQCEYTCEIATTVMPGANYVGYLPHESNPLERCWSVLEGRSKETPSSRRPRKSKSQD